MGEYEQNLDCAVIILICKCYIMLEIWLSYDNINTFCCGLGQTPFAAGLDKQLLQLVDIDAAGWMDRSFDHAAVSM